MSGLSQEILKQLPPITRGVAGELLLSVAFPVTFSGFKGHFPGRPVLPGVCMIQVAIVALGAYHGKTVRLRKLLSAKWLSPVVPEDPLDYVMRPNHEERTDGVQIKVVVTRRAERIAEFTFEVDGLSAGGGAV
jgi:3-hydroxymyristoyl/3-hydroxydecanoyl-(acyl carrier protein) dehydratase